MRIISTLLFALLMTGLSFGQTTYWQEDFANGPKGWTVETSLCGDFSGDLTGQYSLTSLMQNGMPVAGVEGSIAFSTPTDYSAKVTMGGQESLIQGSYTSDGSTIIANTTGATFTLGGATDYMADGSQTAWFANISLDQATLDAWGATALGMGSPNYAFDGGNLIITSADGQTVLTYERTSSCGEYWKWSHNGDLSNGLVAGDGLALVSPSIDNGCMALNADFYITQGVNNPGAPPYPEFVASLISPTIDMSAVTEAVSIEFTQLVRTLNVGQGAPTDINGSGANTSVSVSIDGGLTWSDPVINANANLAASDPPLNNTVNFSLVGVEGQSNVKIRITYAQDFYYWAIDDVKIKSRVPYDMGVNTFFAIMPNAITPQSQLEPVTFEADIQNFGGRTAENVVLNLTITDETGTEVYNSDKAYGSVAPDVLAENTFFDDVFDPANLETGLYTGVYSVSHDSTDNVASNDSQIWNFMVSDTVMSKDFDFTRNVTPSADNTYSYGNCFYIPNGVIYRTQYMWFGVANADELVGQSVTTFLYKWDGDINEDGQANQTEYGDPIAFNSYTFDGTENDQYIQLPIDIDGTQIPLDNDSYYIVLVSYIDQVETPCYLLASEQFDYSAMNFVTDSLGSPRYAGVLSVGNNETDLSTLGFGRDIVPSISMDVKLITSTKEPVLNSNFATVGPNPAATSTMITINKEDVGDINVSLVDMSGKILLNKPWKQTTIGSTLSLDLNQYPSGRYTIRLRTDEGIIVKPLVITK